MDLKKVAKRLNEQHERTGAGFYGSIISGRFFQARVKNNVLQVKGFDGWIDVAPEQIAFRDHNGREIFVKGE